MRGPKSRPRGGLGNRARTERESGDLRRGGDAMRGSRRRGGLGERSRIDLCTGESFRGGGDEGFR